MSNEQQMYRQHKRMRVGTFLTLAVSRDRRARRAATARPPQPSPQLQLQFPARSLRCFLGKSKKVLCYHKVTLA